jgi:hypothetical protein
LKDLAGNKVGALSGSVVTDTAKPTVVGLPTYALTGLATAELEVGGTHTVKTLVGVGTAGTVAHSLTNHVLTFTNTKGKTTTGTNYGVTIGAAADPATCALSGTTITIQFKTADNSAVNAAAFNAIGACSAIGTFTVSATAAVHADDSTENNIVSTTGVDTNLVLTAVEANTFQNVQTVAITDSNGAETCTGSDTAISIGLDVSGASQTVAEAIAAFNADADCNRYYTMSSADTTTEQVDQTQAALVAQTTTGTNDAITVRSKTAGLGGNAYQVQVVDSGGTPSITYTASTKTIVINHDVGGATSQTPAQIKALIDAHATVKNLVDVTVTNNAVELPVQAATALVGGTTRLTVTTTFSEAVTASAGHVNYDKDGNGSDQVNSASTTCVAGTCTSLWTLDGTTHQVVPIANSTEIGYTTGILDLALNALAATTPLLSAP